MVFSRGWLAVFAVLVTGFFSFGTQAHAAQYTSLSVGGFHACAIRTSGQVVCWGYNYYGQIGDGTTDNRLTPIPVPGLTDAKAIAAGDYHSCAVRGSGQVVCWGQNQSGQLGDGTTTDVLSPVPVPGLNDAVSIAAGSAHTCVIRVSGQALCWGLNSGGQVGDGTTTDALTPVPVQSLADAVAIAPGDNHTCAIRTSGQTDCWGGNDYGQLGDGTNDPHLVPTPVPGLADASTITAGRGRSCAVRTSGQAACWGSSGGYGALGDGTIDERLIPTPVLDLADAASIDGGYAHTCAVRASGQALCWGDNEDGELGDGTFENRYSPASVQNLAGTTSISASLYYHTCAIANSGHIYCWGMNIYGQLGDGTGVTSSTPVAVLDELSPTDVHSPISGKTVNLEPVSGVVSTKCPGERRFKKLTGPAQIKVGCQVDTRKGTVNLTSAKAKVGTQSAHFRGGVFRVGQKKGNPNTTLTLTGPARCSRSAGVSAAGAGIASASGRRLWGSGKGRFTTKGKRGSATVRGTKWLVEDRCDGTTFFKVDRGVVKVRDFVRKKTVKVKAGHTYVAGKKRRR